MHFIHYKVYINDLPTYISINKGNNMLRSAAIITRLFKLNLIISDILSAAPTHNNYMCIQARVLAVQSLTTL